jgi:hypothetical protein
MALSKICDLGMLTQKPTYYEMILHQICKHKCVCQKSGNIVCDNNFIYK